VNHNHSLTGVAGTLKMIGDWIRKLPVQWMCRFMLVLRDKLSAVLAAGQEAEIPDS
jgi:hypothetical protein